MSKLNMNNTTEVKKKCPACQEYNKNPKEVTFRRFHQYDKQYYKYVGFVCKCGYIVAEDLK